MDVKKHAIIYPNYLFYLYSSDNALSSRRFFFQT